MNKSKTIIIGDCGSEALGVTIAMLKYSDVQRVVSIETKSNKTTEDQLKDLGYSDRIIQSLLNMESMKQSKQSFEELNEALKIAKPLTINEPKSKYINNPRRNYKR